METQHIGRAIIQNNATDLLVVIPTKRNWLGILFTVAWLCVWLIGELIAWMTYNRGADNFLWLLVWTAGGFFVIRSLLWTLFGKEMIAIDGESLIIEKKGLVLSKPRQFETSRVSNLRVQQDGGGYVGRFVVKKNLLDTGADGIIRFDYGKNTISFGSSVDKTEALAIIEHMKDLQYLNESNFSVA